jgi:hypothetical protein
MASYYGTGSGSLTADPALRGVTKGFGGGEAFNFDSGNKASGGFGSMLGPIAGIASAGASIFSGILGNRAVKDSLRMQEAMHKAAIEEARQGRNAEVAFGLGNRNVSLDTGPRLAFGLQKEAENYQRQFLAPQDLALGSEASKRKQLARISPESKEAALFENFLNMKRTGFQDAARMEGLVGPTGFSRRFTNI